MPTLSKATFDLIAECLRKLPQGLMLPQEVRAAFADTLAQTNPRFDRERFLAACEPQEAPSPKAAPKLPQGLGLPLRRSKRLPVCNPK